MGKRCSKCGQEKSEDCFYKHKKSLYSQCIPCANESSRQSYQRHKQKRRIKGKEWEEKNKEKYSQWKHDYYIRNRERILARVKGNALKNQDRLKAYRKEYHVKNREQICKKTRDWYNANLARVRQTYLEKRDYYVRAACQWARDNPEKAKHNRRLRRARMALVESTLTTNEWIARVEEFESCCAYCGQYVENPTLDHVVPISKGGPHTIDNVVPACHSCNSSKRDKMLIDWLWRKAAYAA